MTPYDTGARRDTPLALKLKDRIRRDGPISVAAYMASCLYDDEHGYYRGGTPIGQAGDFVTAPEISQIFGEIIGAWAAVVWVGAGKPAPFRLVELGPGRGTLMADALRATRRVPGFHDAAKVLLVESSATLRAEQEATLSSFRQMIAWVEDAASLADTAGRDQLAIVIGNEFLDCEPRDQCIRIDGTWRSRSVTLAADGTLTFDDAAAAGAGISARLDRAFPAVADGRIFEPSSHSVIETLAKLGTFAALLIDYGHAGSGFGDTLQAVREHCYEHPLTSPGEADLTMQVDFGALCDVARDCAGIAFDGPVTQAEFLGRLGILERASRLMAANPAKAAGIEAAVARLLSPTGMGTKFKAVGLRSANLPPLPGFERMDNRGRVA